jgi:hypothetical protein
MSWRHAQETDLSTGRKREVVEVTCDEPDCHRWEVVGLHGGSVEKIQRLLLRRGWAWTDVVDGAKDFCPKHVPAAVPA